MHNKYTSTIIYLAILRQFAGLPYPIISLIGYITPFFVIIFFRERTYIAWKNITLCFKNLSYTKRCYLLYKNIRSTFMGLVEAGIVWNFPEKVKTISEIYGTENIPSNEGCILITYHHTATEIAGAIITEVTHYDGLVYRFKDEYLTNYIKDKRSKLFSDGFELFAHDGPNLKSIIKRINNGNRLFYAPDIDLRTGKVMHIDFLDTKAPWEISVGKFIKLANVAVVPYSVHRIKNKVLVRFHNQIIPKNNNLSYEDILQKINEFTEKQVENEPEDYLWVFKRFFTPFIPKGLTNDH